MNSHDKPNSTLTPTAPPSFAPVSLTPPHAAEATESVGAWLARTRTRQGADLQHLARQLALNPRIIQALENDDFDPLGASVFVRGYLSRYARLLNLPETAVLERYRDQIGARQEPPPLQVVHSRARETRFWDWHVASYLLLVVGIGWAAVAYLPSLDPSQALRWWKADQASAPTPTRSLGTTATQVQYPFQSEATETAVETAPSHSPPPTVPTSESTPTAIAALPALPMPSGAPSTVLSIEPVTPAVSDTPPPSEPVTTTATVTPHSPPPTLSTALVQVTESAAVTPAGTSESGAAAAESGVRLMLQFSAECWVEVKDAQGKVLVNGLMQANTTQTLSGPAPFTVTLGNAPAARIALDDRPVDTAVYIPRRGTVSRFTLTP